jgi:ABC-type sugar transport system permease subunit
MPFWTVILLEGRMAIPRDLYEAAEVDGATGLRRFTHVTFPLLANLYLIFTLLSTLFTLGDFNSAFFVSGGAPALSTHVLGSKPSRAWIFQARSIRPRKAYKAQPICWLIQAQASDSLAAAGCLQYPGRT